MTRKLGLFFFFLVATRSLHAQHLSLIRIDSSRFPSMNARIFLDADNQGAREFPYLQLELLDNNARCELVSSLVPFSPSQPASSMLLSMDIGASMSSQQNDNLARYAVKLISEECQRSGIPTALTFFDNRSHIASDYTTDGAQIRDALKRTFVGRAADYTQALTGRATGALNLVNRELHNNFIVLLTDGFDSLDVDNIAAEANQRHCSVFAIGIGSFAMTSLQALAARTRATCFSGIRDSVDLRNAAYTIAGIARGKKCIDVRWTATDVHSALHTVQLRVPTANTGLNFQYAAPEALRARLEHASYLSFGQVQPGQSITATVSLRAVNYDARIDSVEFRGLPGFSSSVRTPLSIKAEDVVEIPITFEPRDSSYTWTRLILHTAGGGQSSLTMSGGFHNAGTQGHSLNILSPLSGESLPADSYHQVRWEGCAPTDYSRVELSVDDGATWMVLQESVLGNEYMMKTPRENREKCRLRITQKASESSTTGVIQVETSRGYFSVQDLSSFTIDARLNPTLVGERSEKTFSSFITNRTSRVLRVEAAEVLGDHPHDFHLSSMAPPYSLDPGQSQSVELSFTPKGSGMRLARLSFKTSAGHAVSKLTGLGLKQSIQVEPAVVDFGIVNIGDSLKIQAPSALLNVDFNKHKVTQMYLVGPDTSQFSLEHPAGAVTLNPKQSIDLAMSFRPTRAGRTSSQAIFISDADDSPHILQLVGNASSSYRDPTSFRTIVSPSASTLKSGELTLTNVDLLGFMACYGLSDNVTVQAAALVPLSISGRTSSLYSLGFKAGASITSSLSVAAGYQYAQSHSDRAETPQTESEVTVHAPYAVATYTTGESRFSIGVGYAFKHHVSIDVPGGFNADAVLGTVGFDTRIAARCKLCFEAYSFRTLGIIPVVGTARYLGANYALDLGLAFLGLRGDTAPSTGFPLAPVVSLTWVF